VGLHRIVVLKDITEMGPTCGEYAFLDPERERLFGGRVGWATLRS
jgi:hypothetical protein